MTLHDVALLHDNWPRKKAEYFAGLAADPPAGFTYSDKTWGYYPGVTGRREALTQFHAIASVVAEVAAKHGVLLNDAGVEKPGEWLGDEWNQRITAHLLLAAVHRAAYCGLALDDLVDFLRGAAPAEKHAGRGSDVPH
ncbi:hypothetical protein ACSNOH_29200 [Streptomyces sp. URMC 127]|uniref:hypothetical protein n=1 Tax=Streptomyces sp. URMC 127 TaxID=3423402 RepID=UPI003F1A23AC